MQGTTVNGYTLQRLLGTGGMAEVWYAENEIGKPAAVKILNDNLSNNAQIVERFHNEALIMVKLSHPNIRQVYSYGYIGNRHCIIQEYLEGTDLESLLKSGRHFTDEELQRWWNQTADALNYTHSMGIVHRDIKPSNLFLDNYGNIKLLDFGIAKVRESISMTRTGAVMGTLMYMSPEQVKDSKYIDHRTDIYSLAVTFVHLLSGKAPYDIDTSGDYEVRKGIVEQPLDLSGVPAAWRGFLTPYLNKEPDQRPALRHFEEVKLVVEQVKQPVVPVVDKATRVVETPQPEPKPEPKPIPKPQPKPTQKPQPKPVELETQPSELGEKPKRKKGLWIGLGVAAVVVAALMAVLFLKVKENREAERYGITRDEAFDRLDYCVSQERDAEIPVGYYELFQLVFHDSDYYRKFLKKTIIRKVKRMDFSRYELNKQTMIDLVEAVYDCQGYDTSLGYSPSQQNTSYNNHDYVDLGLPSGTLWAICNVGASTPEDYGDYFAWGETETKTTYNEKTYKYANGNIDKLTKYCYDSAYGNEGFTDNLTTLQIGDDPATAILGGGWCTPSEEQWKELLKNTTNEWTTRNNVEGRLFIAKNGQTLFLPAAGHRMNNDLVYDSLYGLYWSRSLCADLPYEAWYIVFYSDDCYLDESGYRVNGFSVRPVRDK